MNPTPSLDAFDGTPQTPFTPPTASEPEAPQQPDVLDGLDNLADLSNVDTNRPLIPRGAHLMRLVGMKMEFQKPKDGQPMDPNKKNLLVTLETVGVIIASNGKTLKPGFKHTERISLVTTDKYNPNERLAQMQECFLGAKGKWDTKAFYGREGTVRFDIEKSVEFGDKNRAFFQRKRSEAPSL